LGRVFVSNNSTYNCSGHYIYVIALYYTFKLLLHYTMYTALKTNVLY